MELYLIVRINKVEHPVKFLKRAVLDGTLKTFYRALAVFYVKQFIYGRRLFMEHAQYAAVHECGEQMEPRQM